jgi:hypothetical protein
MSRKKKSAGLSANADRWTASSQKVEAFLVERRRREADNLKRTMELRALRLAHEAANPVVKPVRRKKAAAG